MQKHRRLYRGVKNGVPTLFRAASTPTVASHGHLFDYVTGPFRTRASAMAKWDQGYR
jgi:hypothetical protein